ncbi:aurora kinase A and ninein-interacting protein [Lacerta agilis]|uniref:aurora kinase A and ninein-interacting protein n=1 Tax=Lacerta agilis TaxID=80427 RepID=UPI00141A2888|nr:aurora kinase A and ninein-interacting protein [Lacerta agilis]XP_033013694.1 aurora kinase A and ninein-interacting protein [Lacerta agilis]
MKHKVKCPAQKQPESCGVWLDTSALKKRKIQSFMAKPVLRTLNQASHCPLPTKAPLQCTKQTTISTFFSTQAEEKKTNPNRRLAVASNRASKVNNHGLFRGGKTMLPDDMLEEGGGWTQQTPGLHISPCNSTPPEAQTTTCILPTERRDSAAEREDPQLLNFIQQLEEKRDPDHRTLSDLALREKKSGWGREKHTTLFPHSSQSLTVTNKDTKTQRRHRCPPSCYSSSMQSCDSENINPQLEQRTTEVKPFNQSVAGLCLKINETVCNSDKGIEDSQVGLVGLPMFTQDSEGHKVISHLFVQGRGKTSLQKTLLGDESNSIMSPSYHGCLGACCSAERGTHLSPGGSVSVLTDSSEKSCYDLLFTEDSEGNRVIKH